MIFIKLFLSFFYLRGIVFCIFPLIFPPFSFLFLLRLLQFPVSYYIDDHRIETVVSACKHSGIAPAKKYQYICHAQPEWHGWCETIGKICAVRLAKRNNFRARAIAGKPHLAAMIGHDQPRITVKQRDLIRATHRRRDRRRKRWMQELAGGHRIRIGEAGTGQLASLVTVEINLHDRAAPSI